ncbi:MAG: YegP family protein [Clostridia bacterium]|nr:YegP family protein [Clostridia bacterium]
MGKFVVKTVPSGIKFDLKATNGEIILSSEVYKSKKSCINGINSVIKNSAGAVEDQTVENFEKQRHPKFEMYTDKKGEYRFRLKATNGQIIGVSEGYTTKKACENGIASVKKNAADGKIEEQEEKKK